MVYKFVRLTNQGMPPDIFPHCKQER